MKISQRIALWASLCLPLSLQAQQQNALDLDGVDDQVTVPAASQYISGSTQMSMSMWVNPFNNVTTFPDYDGFAGIRNNTDADFYIIQLPANTIECRFRNSLGAAYDIVYTSLQLNTWQHFVFTYDGASITLYHDGAIVATTPASGTITNNATSFTMGNLEWLGGSFQLLGRLDEVSLWSIALSAQEVTCMFNNGIDAANPGLELYFDCNQGTANGVNTTITSLTNLAGAANGNLSGFQLSGATSNFVPGVASFFTPDSAGICIGGVYNFGTQVLTQPGTYTEAFVSSNGCDSIVELTLSLVSVDTSVAESFGTLTSNQAGATYQWLDCLNGMAVLPGETQQLLQQGGWPNGFYAVAITLNGCTDTSFCHILNANSLSENIQQTVVSLSPNPVNDELFLTTEEAGEIRISDASGRELMIIKELPRGNNRIDASGLAKGIYFVTFRTAGTTASLRFIKN